jgi:hypothetical protein
MYEEHKIMAIVSIDDVWLYVYDQGEVRTRDLEHAFVKSQKISRSTLYKYKRILQAQGKIVSKPVHAQPPYNIYTIPSDQLRAVEALKQYKHQSPKTYGLFPHEMEWQDTPKGFYLTPAKEKILWQNPDTGAMITLTKFPIGLSDAPHIHPEATVMGYVLSGEMERPDGTIVSFPPHVFNCRPKGMLDMGYKITKETILLAFWDGPRTKIDIQMDNETFKKAYATSLGEDLTNLAPSEK